MEKMLISGVAGDKNIAKVSVAGMRDDADSTFRLMNLLAQHSINVDVMIQSIGKDGTKSVSFTLNRSELGEALELINGNLDYLGAKKVSSRENVAKVSVVGAGVSTNPGVAARMFGALASAGINSGMVTSSEIRITAVIREEDADRAMRAIHEAFIGE